MIRDDVGRMMLGDGFEISKRGNKSNKNGYKNGKRL